MSEHAVLEPDAPAEAGPVDRIVQKTPWWSLSVAIHTLAVLVMAYFIVLAGPAQAVDVTIVERPRRVPPLPQMEPIESPLKPTPLRTDRPADNPMITDRPDVKPEDDLDPEHDGLKGQSEDFLTRKPFNSRYANDTIGAGGGAAGRKGGPFGGRFNRDGGRGLPGETRRTDDAVTDALRWLARHQSADGSWGVQAHVSRCVAAPCPASKTALEDYDVGVTGLALLAFLGAGYTHFSKDVHDGICFGDVVRNGLRRLQARQDPEGCVGPRTAHKYMYNHAIAALALTEAHGLTGSHLVRDGAQKAIDFLIAAQNPGQGWRYSYRAGDSDSSVTGWAIMALKSAELCDLSLPRAAYDGCRAWLEQVTDPNYYRAGYTHRATGKVYCAHNQAFDHHEALSAIALMSHLFIERDRSHPRCRGQADLLVADLPVWKEHAIDYYYWYYAALALFQYDGDRGGAHWRRFEERMRDVLLRNQHPVPTGCRAGSWEPVDRWSCEGGRVYATAINALTLEVYYRYANVFTGTRK